MVSFVQPQSDGSGISGFRTNAWFQQLYAWLNKVKTAVEKCTMDDMISWSAYHADAHQAVIPPAAINSLLPLFLDNAHSVAMVRHSMDIVRAAVQNVNPGQIPDQEFEEWCIQRAKTTVHFDYWLKTLFLELLMLRYIRSL